MPTAQDEGGPMGSPLTVVMAEVGVIDNEEKALATCTDPPSLHVHFHRCRFYSL